MMVQPEISRPAFAGRDDVDDILRLRESLVTWMKQVGIVQWEHGEMNRVRVLHEADAGEWWAVRDGAGLLVAAVRTTREDEMIWGPPDRPAIYVHGLMVDRRYAHRQLGSRLLAWAVELAHEREVEVLRLDCVASNVALCRYYVQQGFHQIGRKSLPRPWAPVALFERLL